jgi:intein/homing endonuclease
VSKKLSQALLIRPRFDPATDISWAWAGELAEEIKGKFNLTDLSDGVSRTQVEEAIKSKDPYLIVFYDHGIEGAWIGNAEGEHIIDLTNVQLLTNRIAFTMACLPPDEDIICNPEVKPIAEVEVGDLVFTHSGEFSTVTEKYVRPYSGEIVKIIPKNTNIPLIVTPEHPVFAVRLRKCSRFKVLHGRKKIDGKWVTQEAICKPRINKRCINCEFAFPNYEPEWVEAEKLDENWAIVYPIPQEIKDVEEIRISDYFNYKVVERKGCPACGSTDLAKWGRPITGGVKIQQYRCKNCGKIFQEKLLGKGWYLMDGYWHFKEIKIPDRIPVNEQFMRLTGYFVSEGCVSHYHGYEIQFSFNVKEKEYIDEVVKLFKELFNIQLSYCENGSTAYLRAHCEPIHCLFKSLFGDDALHRKVPTWFLYLPTYKQKAFIETLFDGDAHKDLRFKRKVLGVSSKTLAYQVKLILLRLGHTPPIYKRKNGKTENPIYKIVVFDSGYYQGSWISNGYVFFPIKRISKEKYAGFVYNLEVENNHSYSTITACVHNCRTARGLATEAYRKGCKVYVGYADDFTFNVQDEKMFGDCANYGLKLWLKGESNWAKVKQSWIEFWNKMIDSASDPWTKMFLRSDRDALRVVTKGVDEPTETKCFFRSLALKLFGTNLGWKITRKAGLSTVLLILGLASVLTLPYIGIPLILISYLLVAYEYLNWLR